MTEKDRIDRLEKIIILLVDFMFGIERRPEKKRELIKLLSDIKFPETKEKSDE